MGKQPRGPSWRGNSEEENHVGKTKKGEAERTTERHFPSKKRIPRLKKRGGPERRKVCAKAGEDHAKKKERLEEPKGHWEGGKGVLTRARFPLGEKGKKPHQPQEIFDGKRLEKKSGKQDRRIEKGKGAKFGGKSEKGGAKSRRGKVLNIAVKRTEETHKKANLENVHRKGTFTLSALEMESWGRSRPSQGEHPARRVRRGGKKKGVMREKKKNLYVEKKRRGDLGGVERMWGKRLPSGRKRPRGKPSGRGKKTRGQE